MIDNMTTDQLDNVFRRRETDVRFESRQFDGREGNFESGEKPNMDLSPGSNRPNEPDWPARGTVRYWGGGR